MATGPSKSAIPLEKLSRLLTIGAFLTALMAAVAAPLLALSWGRHPFPGFLVESTLVVNGYRFPGGPEGLSYPQQVLRIGDVAVASPSEFQAVLRAHAAGDSVSLVTRSPEGTTHLYPSVLLGSIPGRDMLQLFWLPYLAGLIYLSIGAWIYAARGMTRPGRALAFFCACVSVVSLLLFDLSTTHAFPFLWTVAVAQIGGTLISLALRFPVEWRPVRSRAWLLSLPYLVSIAFAAWGVLAIHDTARPWAYVAAWGASYRYAALAVATFLAIMAYRARVGEPNLVRRQARLMLFGSALAFLPVSVWFVAPVVGVPLAFDAVLFVPSLVIFPLSVGIAISRYHLSEAEALVNRTLVYGVLTAVLAGVFTALLGLSQKLFVAFTGEKSDAALVITTMIVATAVAPLRKYADGLLTAQFAAPPDAARGLRQLAEQVQAFTRMSESSEIVGYLLEQASSCLRAQSGAVSLESGGRLRVVHTIGRWTGEAWLSVPLECHGMRYGVLWLGPSVDGQQYSREHFDALRRAAAQVARAVHLDRAGRPLPAPDVLGGVPRTTEHGPRLLARDRVTEPTACNARPPTDITSTIVSRYR
ncbi:MAG: hypothetical protein HPY83_00825 [Anaerolineae bacterium]|nr:hypothetical protein [Anaerolineae bacterium]